MFPLRCQERTMSFGGSVLNRTWNTLHGSMSPNALALAKQGEQIYTNAESIQQNTIKTFAGASDQPGWANNLFHTCTIWSWVAGSLHNLVHTSENCSKIVVSLVKTML